MEINDKDIDIIDKYLREKLSPEEQVYFDERNQNDHFAREVTLKQDLKAVYTSIKFDKRKAKLKQIESGINNVGEGKKKTKYFTWLIIALLLIISFVIIYFVNSLGNKNEVLYASYYSPYPNIVTPLQRTTDTENDIFQLYELGDYEDALNKLEQITELNEDQQFYKGLTLLASGKFPQSKNIFEKAISQNSKYRKASDWYLALTLLKLDDIKGSISILERIVNDAAHPFKDRAANLLSELE